MKFYYKDTNNNLRVIDDKLEHLLPKGCVKITDEEVDAIRNPPLEQLKEIKKNVIRNSFNIDSINDVIVDGVSYHGGMDSAMKLEAAQRFAELAGSPTVVFYDITNKKNVLKIDVAKHIVLTIVDDFQVKLSKKQAAMIKIDSAKTEAALNKISY